MLIETKLRAYDKALRLRQSFESDTWLLERKTFRGRIGSIGPQGLVWSKDVGRRREEGHVLIMSIHRDELQAGRLLDSLRLADTWKHEKPLWQRIEENDERKAKQKKMNRSDIIRYKTSDLFDRYVWKYKQRVNVPVSIA